MQEKILPYLKTPLCSIARKGNDATKNLQQNTFGTPRDSAELRSMEAERCITTILAHLKTLLCSVTKALRCNKTLSARLETKLRSVTQIDRNQKYATNMQGGGSTWRQGFGLGYASGSLRLRLVAELCFATLCKHLMWTKCSDERPGTLLRFVVFDLGMC